MCFWGAPVTHCPFLPLTQEGGKCVPFGKKEVRRRTNAELWLDSGVDYRGLGWPEQELLGCQHQWEFGIPSLPSDHNSWCCPLKSVPPLLCSFPVVCMGGKVSQMYEVQTGEILNILMCMYWKLCNSMWEGISCNRIKFNYLRPKVVNIEQFKDQFPCFSVCSCSQN